MIDIILLFFKTDRTFAGALKLYMKYGSNQALLRKLNLQGDTPNNREMLFWQLFKLTGFPEIQYRQLMRVPVGIVAEVDPEETEENEDEDPDGDGDDDLVKFDALKHPRFKLREEFPFLNAQDCPDAFKVLVADMLTAYDAYVKAHEDLFNVTDDEGSYAAADKLVTNYLENHEIWAELAYYKKHGKILGEHFYFESEKRRKELVEMSIPALIELRRKTEHNIWRNKKKIEKEPGHKLTKQREQTVNEYVSDLKIINQLIPGE